MIFWVSMPDRFFPHIRRIFLFLFLLPGVRFFPEDAARPFLRGHSASGIYTRTDGRCLVLADGDRLLVEECDGSFRPLVRTEWLAREQVSRMEWIYPGEGLYPCTCISVSEHGSERVRFDHRGRETEVLCMDGDGVLRSRTRTEYREGGTADGKTAAVVRETFSPQGETESETETVFHYHAGGDLESEDFFSDGVLQKRIRYLGENRRIETVFDGGRELFSQEYADGVPVQNAPDGQRGG